MNNNLTTGTKVLVPDILGDKRDKVEGVFLNYSFDKKEASVELQRCKLWFKVEDLKVIGEKYGNSINR